MSNWVHNSTHIVASAKGSIVNVDKLLNDITKMKQDGERLFNHFVPMPKIYRDYDLTNHDPDDMKVGETLVLSDYDCNRRVEITQELIDEWQAIKKAMRDEFGAIGWYDWSRKYWGTKWDVFNDSLTVGTDYFEYDTAWNCPHAFLLALSKLHPELRFINWYADEDYGSNCGVIIYENGKYKDFDGAMAFSILHWDGYEYDFDYYFSFDEMNTEEESDEGDSVER